MKSTLTGHCACILACHEIRCNRVNNKQTFSSHDLIGPKAFGSVHRCDKSSHSRHNFVQTFYPEQIIQLTSNMLVSGHDLIQALETSHNFLCLRHHLSANKNLVLSDYLPNASEGQRQSAQRSYSCSDDARPSCTLVKKSMCRSATCLSLHAISAQQVWLQLHICYCNAQHQVTRQASTIA